MIRYLWRCYYAKDDMEVMVNTNEPTAGGGWDFTGEEIVKRNAPASIVDPERFNANQDLAETDMFDAQEIDLPLYHPGTSDNTEVKEAIVLRYYGHCRTENGQRIYDIYMKLRSCKGIDVVQSYIPRYNLDISGGHSYEIFRKIIST